MNDLICSRCGDRTVLARCAGCHQRSATCTCQPIVRQPVWLRNLAAKDMTRAAA